MVAHAANERGHQVDIYDLFVDGYSFDKLIEYSNSFRPDYIGMSLRNIDNAAYDNLDTYFQNYKSLCQGLKENISCPVILGGSAFSLFPEILLERMGADYGITGEGEIVFPKLIDQLENGKTPENKILCAKSHIPGREIAICKRDSRLADHYLQFGGMLNIQTKRGCPHRCAYCAYPLLEGREFRFRPACDVVDEIELLINKYGAAYISITDSVFNDSHGKYLEIAEEIVRRELKIPWMAYFRPTYFKRDEVELLKRAGLVSVEWGSDASTDTTLEEMQKGFSWDEVLESSRMFNDAGISNAHFFIFGGPNETVETVKEGLNNIEKLSRCVVFAFNGIRIIPGTPIHRRAINEGMISREDDLLEPKYYFSPETTPEYITKEVGASFRNRIDRISSPGSGQEKISILQKMGFKGPIWDLILKA